MDNETRIEYAARVVDRHIQYAGDNNDEETNLIDLVTNLIHWSECCAVDFDNVIRIAKMHYEEETE